MEGVYNTVHSDPCMNSCITGVGQTRMKFRATACFNTKSTLPLLEAILKSPATRFLLGSVRFPARLLRALLVFVSLLLYNHLTSQPSCSPT